VFGRLISLETYRRRKIPTDSARSALARLEPERPAYPASFFQDHRLAFLASAERHGTRALSLLLSGRPISAGMHHLISLLFRHYAESDELANFNFIHEHMSTEMPEQYSVHTQTLVFFRAVGEAFYCEHSCEILGAKSGRFSVVDDFSVILDHFRMLGYERQYNAMLEAYDSSLQRNDSLLQGQILRQTRSMMN
jgi:hypothetical protein